MTKNKLTHVAFILDGNKRWAKKNNHSNIEGYKAGFDKIKEIVNYSIDLNLKNLTLFTLSSENIKRSSINIIYEIIYNNFSFLIDELVKNKNININIFGSENNLPNKIKDLLEKVQSITHKNPNLNLNLAFNYGFKDEIKDVLHKYKKSNFDIDLDNEKNIRRLFNLNSSNDPEILIRTGGYKRLSNFIMYNLTYTELIFTETLWPDFSIPEYDKIINNFYKINRKYGL